MSENNFCNPKSTSRAIRYVLLYRCFLSKKVPLAVNLVLLERKSERIVCPVTSTVAYHYFSLPRARERLCHARQYRDLPEAQKLSRLQKAHRSASSITSFGSQVGDTRPLSSCNFSPNSGTVQYFDNKCTKDLG